MPYITDYALATYQEQTRSLSDARAKITKQEQTLTSVSHLVLGALRCGTVNENQRQALFLALEHLTGEPYVVLRLIMDVTPKAFRAIDSNE